MSDDTTPPEGGAPDLSKGPGQPPEHPAAPPPSPYGAQVPPPAGGVPPPAYVPPPTAYDGSGGGYNPVEAIKYGWGKFSAKPSSLLVPVLVVFLIAIIIEVIVQVLLYATFLGTHDCTKTIFGTSVDTQCGPSMPVRLLGAAIGAGIGTFISSVLGAGLIKSALNVADHQPVEVGDIFTYAGKSEVISTAGVLAGLAFVGTLLCYFPAIIISFLTVFTMFYVVDKGVSGIDAVKASYSLVTKHLGDTILFYLLAAVCFIVGAILCVVGLLVAIPVVLAGAAYTYRLLNSEPVSPVDAR